MLAQTFAVAVIGDQQRAVLHWLPMTSSESLF
jgi:hypothetical protein